MNNTYYKLAILTLGIIISMASPDLRASSQREQKPSRAQQQKADYTKIMSYRQLIVDYYKAGKNDAIDKTFDSLSDRESRLFAIAHEQLYREGAFEDIRKYRNKRGQEPLYVDGYRLPDAPEGGIGW